MNERAEKFFGRYSPAVLEKFRKFHDENPHIYNEFKKLANKMRVTGRKKYSAKMIINVLRWERDLQTKSNDEFKLNDLYQSMYARLLAYHHPEFENFFSFKGHQK